ncbi:hypothetical protein [Ruegeria atlantica]|nr:hypothetical protein [Ruegeria atlantica]
MAKNESHSRRMGFVADGNRELERVEHLMLRAGLLLGVGDQSTSRPQVGAIECLLEDASSKMIPSDIKALLVDHTGQSEMVGIHYPFHFIKEPHKRVIFRTDPTRIDFAQMAQFAVRAGTHPVDMYHSRARNKVMGFERSLTTSGLKSLWYYKQYYNPVMVMKLVDILRFAHNCTDLMVKESKSPAMKLGIAKGFVYDRDLFSF